MVVTGSNITVEQAAEILLRTDINRVNFDYSGNDREYRKELKKLFSFMKINEDDKSPNYWKEREEILIKYKILSWYVLFF